MPYCPKCRAEYVRGITRCPDCDQDLVDTLPEPERYFGSNVKPVLLCKTNDVFSTNILSEALKELGIPCLIKSGAGTFSGFMPATQATKGVKIYVPETAIDKAIELAETIIPDFEMPDEKE